MIQIQRQQCCSSKQSVNDKNDVSHLIYVDRKRQ